MKCQLKLVIANLFGSAIKSDNLIIGIKSENMIINLLLKFLMN
jgi:hypothetical protein